MQFRRKILTAVAVANLITFGTAQAAEDVVFVYDASGSMWGQVDGTSKVETARQVLAELVHGWPENVKLGLVAYGHRSEGDCQDIETLIPPGQVNRTDFVSRVSAIRPRGKTPLSAAIQHAADLLSFRDHPATVVLISDGVETCQADPCAVSQQLARQGVKFTAHVVGFDLQDEAHKKLACIAENTGGLFLPAANAAELKSALMQVQRVVEAAPAETPTSNRTESQLAEISPHSVRLEAPSSVLTGAPFEVSWSEIFDPQDYVTIVPAGADEDKYGNYIRVRDKRQGSLVAPSEPGLYEVRYVSREGNAVQGSIPVEVEDAEVEISAPAQATAGSMIKLAWSSSVHPQDYITIVPAGADEGKYGDYIRVRDKLEGSLIVPAEAGLYEVRYVLQEGNRTLARSNLELTEAEIGIAAPPVVRAGTKVRVSWSASVHPQDYVTIVPAGAKEGSYGDYVRVRNHLHADLTVPGEEGLYEVRYILHQGDRTMASAPLEVIAADAPLDDGAGLTAPGEASPGTTITVSWSGGSDSTDQRISIARADQPDFSWVTVHRIKGDTSMNLTVPKEPGTYEIRYLDISNRKILGRSILQVR